eukprot:gene7499-11822_t
MTELKEIKLKTDVNKRYYKDYITYIKEEKNEKETLSQMNKDENDKIKIKQQKNVLNETSNMIERMKESLVESNDELLKILEEYESDEYISKTEEYKSAKESYELSNNLFYED